MKSIPLFVFMLTLFFYSCEQQQNNSINLSGKWQFQMDPKDIGVSEKWFENDLLETIKLPGSMVENGKGFDITMDTEWTGGVRNPEWDAMSHSDAIKLIDFPVELKPIVRIIDDWVINRRLALLFEAKVGEGKIMVSSALKFYNDSHTLFQKEISDY